MKKNIIFAFLLAGAVMTTGCGKAQESSSADKGSSQSDLSSNVDNSSDSEVSGDSDITEKVFSGLPGYEGDSASVNLAAGGILCETDTGIMYADDTGIYSIDGDKTTLVYEGKGSYLNYLNGRVNFIDEKGNICVIFNGKAIVTIKECGAVALATSVTGNYYIDDKGALHRVYGGDFIINSNAPDNLTIAGDYVIFNERDNGNAISAYSSKTGKTVVLSEYGEYPAVCGNYLFFINKDQGIDRLDLTDGTVVNVVDSCSGCFVPADDTIYYVDADQIFSVSTDGGTAESIYSSQNDAAVIEKLTVCGGKLYFAEDGVIKVLENGEASDFVVSKSADL